ncbi:DUF2062 domain-containing protein [bacterium]|nr:DUF2062 domain-containing protein [bacterium]
MKESIVSYIKRFRHFLYQNIIAIRSSPHDIALGLAIGVFVGFLPIMGFQTIVAIPLAILFRASKVTSAIGVWISNPVTFIPFYYFNFRVGRWMLGDPDVEWAISKCTTFWKIIELGGDILYPLLLGCVVLGFISVPIIYFGSFKFVVYYRKIHNKRLKKHATK